ncbi:MAG: serine hydrolase, partial [Deltaproteobacteria bacterium]
LSRLSTCYTRLPGSTEATVMDDPSDSQFARPRTFLSGGGGLVSTAADYLRFCEMLRRGGELDGARLLGPRTVAYMTRNHLPDERDLASLAMPGAFSETRYDGVGFGLGFYVVTDPVRAQVPTSPGEYGWGGLASTAFWVVPAEDLVVIFLTQLVPSTTFDFRGQLKAIIHSAIID